MNVFDCAIKIEEESEKFYRGLQKETRQPDMKDLFSFLAASEKEHRTKLMKLKESIPPEKASIKDLDGVACSFTPHLTQQELLSKSRNDRDLYLFTIREEEQEIEFYEKLAAKATDDGTRKTLQMLAEEERRHLVMMENIYAFVETPKTYLASGEFSNLHEL